MLVLTRKTNQGVVVSGPTRVVVLAVDRDRVRLGFEADDDVTILRDELIERAQAEANDEGTTQ